MSTSIQQSLQSHNDTYASNFTSGDLPLPPSQHYVVLTCMDARIDPISAFGISPPLGTAHVIRNAGASARDALRSLVISNQLLATKEILVIKHTGCGMETFDDAGGREVVRKQLGEEAAEEVKGWDWKALKGKGVEQGVKEDVEFLRGSKVIGEGVVVSGWIYEVETGKARKVI